MKKNLIITIAVMLLIGGASFYGGMIYQKTQVTAGPGGMMPTGNNQRMGGMTTGSGSANVNGEILDVDDQAMTIQSEDGSSKIIIYSDSTNINKTTTGSSEDLIAGEAIMVIGTEDDSGTITAKSIAIGGNFGGGMASGAAEVEAEE